MICLVVFAVEKLLPETPKLEYRFLPFSTIQLHWLQLSDTNEITYLIQKKENGKWNEEKQVRMKKKLFNELIN